jgi:hypothetical protein
VAVGLHQMGLTAVLKFLSAYFQHPKMMEFLRAFCDAPQFH